MVSPLASNPPTVQSSPNPEKFIRMADYPLLLTAVNPTAAMASQNHVMDGHVGVGQVAVPAPGTNGTGSRAAHDGCVDHPMHIMVLLNPPVSTAAAGAEPPGG